MSAFVVGLLGTLAALLLHRLVHRGRVGVTPLAAYYGWWTLTVTLTVWNPFGFTELRVQTWELVLMAVLLTTLGYSAGLNLILRRGAAGDAMANWRPTRTLFLFLACVGGVLFFAFLPALLRLGLLSNPGTALYRLRVALGQGDRPGPGFYFFYFFQPLVPVAVLLYRTTRKRGYLVVAAGAALSLLLTSGRTNATIAVLWTAACLALLSSRGGLTRRQGLTVVGAGLASLAVFVLLGNAVGKTYENSVLSARYGNDPPVPKTLVLPVYYVTGTLPTLNQITAEPGGGDTFGNSLRPLLQLGELGGLPVTAPEKIQVFYFIPDPFNLATYLSPLWRDGGWFGVAVGSFLLGAVTGAAYGAWQRRRDHATLLLAGLATVTCCASVLDASYSELSVLFQIGLLLVMAGRLTRLRQQEERDVRTARGHRPPATMAA